MFRFQKLLFLSICTAICLQGTSFPAASARPTSVDDLAYPDTARGDTVDTYHGVSVADPYRWLENSDAADTRNWIESENKLTKAFLDRIPERKAIEERLTQLWNYPRASVPVHEGNRLFYTKNTGLQNQSVLYVQNDGASARLLLDPNTLSKDGTVNLSSYEARKDGKMLVYGLSASGSDWEDWYFKDVDSGKTLPDHLKWLKNAHATWAPDGKGVYYGRFDEPKSTEMFREANYFQKLFYHELGTEQSEDKLVYERKEQKEWDFDPVVTDDGKYLIIEVSHGTSPKNGIFIKDLTDPASKVVELFQPGVAMYQPVGNDGSTFWFVTDEDAPKAKIIAVSTQLTQGGIHGDKADLIKSTNDTLESASFINDRFICTYLKDAASAVMLYDKNGHKESDLSLPGIGTASGFGGHQYDKETYYSFSGFVTPPAVYKLDVPANRSQVFFQPKLKFDPNQYTTEQIFCQSKDGTRIPIFVNYKKGTHLDGSNPTYLYGYGGFNISMQPFFSPSNLLWMERGGIYAVAILRGGGEYGTIWHESGMKLKKQNVFDDFISAAEALIEKRYTSKEKLSIGGGSNGGLLVGACLTQRPDLYGAAVAAVGVMDMLRFNKFTVGWAWQQEYGSPDDAAEFKALYAYSPLHNIKKGVCYPATLITTADHDDRVVPGHSFKFGATLQAAQTCAKPTLIRIDTKAGHGHGKSTKKLIDEATDKWTFLTKTLNADKTVASN